MGQVRDPINVLLECLLCYEICVWFRAAECIVAVCRIQAASYLVWTAEKWRRAEQRPSYTVWRGDQSMDGQSADEQEHCWYWGSR